MDKLTGDLRLKAISTFILRAPKKCPDLIFQGTVTNHRARNYHRQTEIRQTDRIFISRRPSAFSLWVLKIGVILDFQVIFNFIKVVIHFQKYFSPLPPYLEILNLDVFWFL